MAARLHGDPGLQRGAHARRRRAAKLESDDPDLEVILIDDRSIDAMAEIVDRLAAHDARVRGVHVRALPAGWLGKLNATKVGVEKATGEPLLLTDADVHIAAGTLHRVIAHAESRRLDHVAAFPHFWPVSFWLDATLSVFVRLACLGPHGSKGRGALAKETCDGRGPRRPAVPASRSSSPLGS